MINNTVLVGRLTKDPTQRATKSGKAVTTFTLAVDRQFEKDAADFIQIVTWNKTAENCGKYLNKGSLVAVVGRIQARNYEDNDGKKVYITEVVADNVRFLGGRKNESLGNPEGFTPVEDDENELPF